MDAGTLGLFLVHDPYDEDAARELAAFLERFEITVEVGRLDRARDAGFESLDAPLARAVTVGVVAGGKGISPAHEIAIRKARSVGDRPPPAIAIIQLHAEGSGAIRSLVEAGQVDRVFDLSEGLGNGGPVAPIADWVREQTAGASGGPDDSAVGQAAPRAQNEPPPDAAPSQSSSAAADASVDPSALQAAFNRLTRGARRALAEADKVRAGLGASEVHMEHLLVGLYRLREGRTRSALNEAGVDSARLASLLKVSVTDIGPPIDGDATDLTGALPALSRHAALALLGAADAAVSASGAPMDIRARHLFYGALGVRPCDPIDALATTRLVRADVLIDPPPAPPVGLPIAGFRSDDADGTDLLNIHDEVEALATVIAARQIEPPLAIGLFGDWGTGKTFFMNRLEQRIEDIALAEQREERDDPTYCRHIVQLRFNAWHYIDQDLWASLAAAIFEGLDEWISRPSLTRGMRADRRSKRAELLTQQARAREKLDEAERQGDASRRSVADTDERLKKLDGQYDELARSVAPIEMAGAMARIVADQPELSAGAAELRKTLDQQVDKAAADLQRDPAVLKAQLAKGSYTGLLEASRTAVDWRLGARLWVPIAAVVVVVLAAWVVIAPRVDPGPLVRAAAVGLSVVAVAISPLLGPAARLWGVVRDARAESGKLIEAARSRQREALLETRRQDEERRIKAELDAAAARRELEDVRTGLDAYTPSREMATFVKRRQESTDYRSRLGVVAKARDDFEELSALLSGREDGQEEGDREAASEGTEGGDETDGTASAVDTRPFPQPIDRIVLYVDDLDRCKEKEVVAVLQAVHLLLAFQLFVVVVAVDPRWLLHSLRVSSRAFEEGSSTDADDEVDDQGWESTPLNYLEKIFQIPFALRPMGETGFKAVIGDLTRRQATERANGAPVGEAATGAAGDAGAGRSATAGAHDTTGSPPQDGGRAVATPGLEQAVTATTPTGAPGNGVPGTGAAVGSDAGSGDGAAPPRDVVLDPAWLEIGTAEREYMTTLHELIATPRAAKRFVNVYRLLKASSPAEAAAFEDPSRHCPILQLLAILTGYPSEATDILRALVERKPSGSWLAFIRGLARPTELLVQTEPGDGRTRPAHWTYARKGKLAKADLPEADRWASLLTRLERIEAAGGELDASAFTNWARPVARYGFESSRILVTGTA